MGDLYHKYVRVRNSLRNPVAYVKHAAITAMCIAIDTIFTWLNATITIRYVLKFDVCIYYLRVAIFLVSIQCFNQIEQLIGLTVDVGLFIKSFLTAEV